MRDVVKIISSQYIIMKKIFLLFLIIISTQVFSKGKTVDRIYTKEEEEIIKNYLGTFYFKGLKPTKHLVIVPSDQYGKIAVFDYVTPKRHLCTPEFDDFDLYEGMNASTCMFLDCLEQGVEETRPALTIYIIYCKTEDKIKEILFEEKEYFERYKECIRNNCDIDSLYHRIPPHNYYYYRLEEKGE